MFRITVAIFDIPVSFLLGLFCIAAGQNQMERRANGKNVEMVIRSILYCRE
jgi:hypothetical protein